MRRSDKEIKSKKEIENIIKAAKVCRIGFADGNQPYVLAFNYGYKAGFVYIHCAAEGRKLEIIRKNPLVAVEIDTEGSLVEAQEPCEYGFRYKSVVAFGKASIVDNRAEKIKALKAIMKQATGKLFNKFRESKVEAIKIIRIKLSSMTGKKSGF